MSARSPKVETVTFATRDLPMIDYGDGVNLYDQNGKRYLDGSGGAAIFCLGHRHPVVTQAIKDQLDRIAHGYRNHFDSEPLLGLNEIVARRAGGNLSQMVLASSGSEAVEGCLSIAMQYHHANGEPERKLLIGRDRSYHGSTFGALSVTGFGQRKFPFEGGLIKTYQIPTPNMYRLPAGLDPDQVGHHYADKLQAKIEELGPERVAAFIFEPVVGAAMGVMLNPDGYAQRVREICDKYGVLLIADEVMSGCGRTGPWRALEHDNVEPDLLAVAKGLGGGYIPIGASIFTEHIGNVIEENHGRIITGHTFTGHTAACAGALAVQTIMEQQQLDVKVRADGVWFGEQLNAALADHPNIGNIRGRGFFWGVEFVADEENKTPFVTEMQIPARLKFQTMANGVICYPVNGFVNHEAGDAAIIAPSYLATRAELSEIIDRFAKSCREMFADLPVL